MDILSTVIVVLFVLYLFYMFNRSMCHKYLRQVLYRKQRECGTPVYSVYEGMQDGAVQQEDAAPPSLSYTELAARQSLEPEIFEGHSKYTEDMIYQGASLGSVRSDRNDVVPWVGFRRPDYRPQPDTTSRAVPSEFPHQLPDKNTFTF